MPFSKILVANRSEIAIRVFRAANELGLKTVAIWAEEDKYALHRFKADESYQVGRGPHLSRDLGPIESYLSIEEVSHDQLRTHLADFMAAYNFGRRLKTLGGLTPYEYIAKIWTSEPKRFIVNPIHQMPGLNT